MAITIEERRARDRARQKVKNDAAALAAGRVPGRIGQPPVSDEHRAATRARRSKIDAAYSLKKRTADRAAKAVADGRVPGRPGKKCALVTLEQRKAAACARAKKYRDANLEKVRAADLARNAVRVPLQKLADPVAYKLAQTARAAAHRVRQNGGFSPNGLTAIVRRVWDRADGHCAACSAEGANLELDHIVAVINGGDNSEGNFQFLCMPCNRSKSDKDYDTWLQSRRLAA